MPEEITIESAALASSNHVRQWNYKVGTGGWKRTDRGMEYRSADYLDWELTREDPDELASALEESESVYELPTGRERRPGV